MAGETKERILKTALELFAQSGYLGTSMSDIAARLGITKAALYKHYAGKQEILDRIVQRMNELDAARAAAYEMPGAAPEGFAQAYLNTPLDRIRAYSTAQFDHWTREPFSANFRKMLTLEQYRDARLAQLYQENLASGPVKYMVAIFRPLTDSDETAMQLALDTPGIDGVVLDPWSNSASLDGALLNGLLHAGHTPEGPGAEEAEAGKEAARAGHWAAAAECYQKAAEQGSSAGLSLLGECLYQGRGVPKSAAQARKLWKAAAESGEPIALLNLGDDCAARGDNGKALLWYRRARQNAAAVPDIEYTPRVCLRLAQFETRYTSRKKALAQAAEAKQAFTILQREHEPDADRWLQETEQLLYALTHEPPTAPAAYNIESLQLD